jgi:hypothetical protein
MQVNINLKNLLSIGMVLFVGTVAMDIINPKKPVDSQSAKIADDMESAYQQIKAANDQQKGLPVDEAYIMRLRQEKFGK